MTRPAERTGRAAFPVTAVGAPGVSVWSNGRVLWWRTADGGTDWPAADLPGAARRLAELMSGKHPR